MTANTPSYRPHDAGHDYYSPGIYLITLVVRNRAENTRLFGVLNEDPRQPAVLLNDIGRAVMACWEQIPERQQRHGRCVALHGAVCMPDHFHGVIEIKERMDVSLGEVIRGFKAGCTMAWREEQLKHQRPNMVVNAPAQPYLGEQGCQQSQQKQEQREMLKRMSKKQRAEYYAQHPEVLQPLWDDNYDDTICLSDPVTGEYSERHFAAMKRYVADNARRAIIRHMRPEFMRRCLHVTIAGRDYAAFGNLFLLRWARKVQVFCHRSARYGQLSPAERQQAGLPADGASPEMVTRVAYENTEAYRAECRHWEALVMAGQTVIVTPGISKGELMMKNRCLDNGWPLIHLQKEPIGAYWKPEEKRFNACISGSLLIMAPWKADALGAVNGVPSETDYATFHNLNRLAEELCLFDGEARIKRE